MQKLSSYVVAAVCSAVLGSIQVPKNTQASDVEFVDSHDVLLLDVSGSMDEQQILAAFVGAAANYQSESSKQAYAMGICSANTVVYYSDLIYIGPTRIICSPEDAEAYGNYLVASFEDARAKTTTKSINTNIFEALDGAITVFASEGELNIQTLQRRVVVIGDETGASKTMKARGLPLTTVYNAKIFGIAVMDAGVADAFNRGLVSDPQRAPAVNAMNAVDVGHWVETYLSFTNG